MNSPVHLVGRVGTTLRAVATHEPGGATTSEVARTAGLSRPTVHRLLTSMLEEGLTDRTREGRWLLGPELYLLGTSAATRYDVTELAHSVVRHLAIATGESAFFSARRGNETVCLLREDGSHPIRSHVLHEGIRFPLGVASAGLVILAHLPDPEVEDHLARARLEDTYGELHASDRVRERIAQTRVSGYALNPGLLVAGSWGMGAAVFDEDGRPAWALSITGIEHRFSEDRRAELGTLLLDSAHRLTGDVGRRRDRARTRTPRSRA
ncbi:IclR family transcriptional regulator [Nocardioides hwasunensis]|uniref:IclR family transcriptional regulator n=1 Tax=Nocardioides hwasunensis TaxID=397258 RepID=A0ABR8MFS4_9ACTN|nr:IclR family transcriptional regulator [Nocardioides hwasunensis]MBD3914807.1 IclR family transcriptional regulator [Nocardioides hwasunensis]